ncbi:Gfo/Idh/MocA family protein [Verrucomicrobiota bacterium]
MIRAAFIGTGGISGAHLRYLAQRDDVEISALCDVDPEHLQGKRAEFGGRPFADFNEMLDTARPDAVWLCTPPLVRRAPLLACAERGIPVFCEKPVERGVEEAERIAAELGDHGRRVQVGYVFRSMPVVQQLRKAMADDKIGAVQSFYGCDFSLRRSAPSWFYEKELSGGGLVDQATHNLDLLRMLLGEVREVRGLVSNPIEPQHDGYTVDEVIGLSLLFENGTVGGHLHTWISDGWRNEMLLSGEKRSYRLSLGRGTLAVEDGGEASTFEQDQGRMFEHQNARFLELVASGDASLNPCPYPDGVETLRLTLMCDAAATRK